MNTKYNMCDIIVERPHRSKYRPYTKGPHIAKMLKKRRIKNKIAKRTKQAQRRIGK